MFLTSRVAFATYYTVLPRNKDNNPLLTVIITAGNRGSCPVNAAPPPGTPSPGFCPNPIKIDLHKVFNSNLSI